MYVKSKWEKEVNIKLSEDDWLNICKTLTAEPGPTVPSPECRQSQRPPSPMNPRPVPSLDGSPAPPGSHTQERAKTHPNNTGHVPPGLPNAPTVREPAGVSNGSPTPAKEGPCKERRQWAPRDTPPVPDMSKSHEPAPTTNPLPHPPQSGRPQNPTYGHTVTHTARPPPDRNTQTTLPPTSTAMPWRQPPPTHPAPDTGTTGSQSSATPPAQHASQNHHPYTNDCDTQAEWPPTPQWWCAVHRANTGPPVTHTPQTAHAPQLLQTLCHQSTFKQSIP
ncbi:extensin-like [Micropterus salmoides]|uniref:extensin-like n=1 Tax=Micropterus salmoides TaxID=27706 RepID=UPI0018EE0496|nr:extensin-like [Micropterus salmoides]